MPRPASHRLAAAIGFTLYLTSLVLPTPDHLGREITGVLPFGAAGSRCRGMLLSSGRGT